jgi:hypothetical protein
VRNAVGPRVRAGGAPVAPAVDVEAGPGGRELGLAGRDQRESLVDRRESTVALRTGLSMWVLQPASNARRDVVAEGRDGPARLLCSLRLLHGSVFLYSTRRLYCRVERDGSWRPGDS